MLDIIIPAYNAHKTIWNTLFSIVYQKFDKPFNVYIVNDASEQDYSEEINFFKKYINIKEITLNVNSGPGVARQKGIDESNGDYIIFIDADDVFSDSFAFRNLYNEISKYDCDQVSSIFVEEKPDDLILHGDSSIWLHGKIYKRNFIQEHNIRFNNSRINEDNGFNLLFELCGYKKRILNVKTYIWRYNKNSITRVDKDNSDRKFLYGYTYNMLSSLNWGIQNKVLGEKIGVFSFNALSTIYLYYLKYGNSGEFLDIYKLAKKILNINKQYPIEEHDKNEIFHTQYTYLLETDEKLFDYIMLPKETMYDFLNYIDTLEIEGVSL